MDNIQQPPGQQERGSMNVIEILQKVAREQATGMSFEEFIQRLYSLLQDDKYSLIQIGNTVFLMHRTAPDAVEVHTFSSESPRNLIQNYIGAAKFLKNQGIKKAVTYADSPGYVEIAKKTGLPVKVGTTTRVQAGTAKPMYSFELEL